MADIVLSTLLRQLLNTNFLLTNPNELWYRKKKMQKLDPWISTNEKNVDGKRYCNVFLYGWRIDISSTKKLST